jgi:hypothetical protein
VISELIHYTAAGNIDGVSTNGPLIQVIVPQVMNLKSQLSDSTKVNRLSNLHPLRQVGLAIPKHHSKFFRMLVPL